MVGFLLASGAMSASAQSERAQDLDDFGSEPLAFAEVSDQARIQRLNRTLSLTPAQSGQIDPWVQSSFDRERSVRADTSLSSAEKRRRIHEDRLLLKDQIKPLLSPEQLRRLDGAIGLLRSKFHFQIAAKTSVFYPSEAVTRDIFGGPLWAYSIGLEGYRPEIGNRSRWTFSGDLGGFRSHNSVFLAAGVAHYEYRAPITKNSYTYVNVLGGPAYFDYSYDYPDGAHVAAKRFGAEGGLEVGVKWGPLRVAASYHAYTEPAGISFNGFGATVSFTFLHVAFP